ncbi:hypothetical protein Tco_0304004 [Tanacetum coccineum]
MEPAADACASMAALVAASLVVMLGVGDRRCCMGFNMERILSTLMVLSTVMFQGVQIFVSRISLLRVMMMWICLQFYTGFDISWVMGLASSFDRTLWVLGVWISVNGSYFYSYKGVWISVYVVLGIKSSTSLQLLSAAVLSYYFLQQINTASSRLTTVDRVTTTG